MTKRSSSHQSMQSIIPSSNKIMTTKQFEQGWMTLSYPLRQCATGKIALLTRDPAHRSLQAPRLHAPNQAFWVCYINRSYRLVYQFRDG